MEDFSFMLLKPNGISNNLIYPLLLEQFRRCELYIHDERTVLLTRDKIRKIWPQTERDPVVQEVFVRRYCGIPLPLLMIRGENALYHVYQIKKKIRNLFALNAIDNCLHCPQNQTEYQRDTAVLFSCFGPTNLKCPAPDHLEYSNCITENQVELIERVIAGLDQPPPFNQPSKEQYSLYLEDTDSFWLGDLVDKLYCTLASYPKAEIYLICVYLGYSFDRIVITENHDLGRLLQIQNKLSCLNIRTTIVNNQLAEKDMLLL